MSARIVVILISLIDVFIQIIKMRLADLQRKQPLPEEVADVYAPERYQQYLCYVADNRKSGLLFGAVRLVLFTVLILSGVFREIENIAKGNLYIICLLTFTIFTVIEASVDIPKHGYDTFVIREKYGLNKQTIKDFVKDTILGFLQDILIGSGLFLLLTFISGHLFAWTSGFSISLGKAFLIGIAILAAVLAFALLAGLFSIWILKKQYTFTPMPDGDLRVKIMSLQEGSKKKVRKIYIYDESKKSTSKNAFLLKFLWHREFGIADNFMNENEEEELLAVLSHEIGHLKHRKNLLNFFEYAQFVLLFLAVVWLIYRPGFVLEINEWIRRSFELSINNMYVWVFVFSSVLTPVLQVMGIIRNYRSRQEEFEADREAVKNGYGEAMIATFKRLSSDELINVNPHPLIEFLEYDHPGMAGRIRAIREAEKQYT